MTDKEKEYINLFAKYVCSIRPYPGKTTKWGAEKPIESKIEDAIKQCADSLKAYSAVSCPPRGQRTIYEAQAIVVKAMRQGATKEHPYIVGILGANKKYAQAHKEALEKIFAQWKLTDFIKLDVVEFKKKPTKKPQSFIDDFLQSKKEGVGETWFTRF